MVNPFDWDWDWDWESVGRLLISIGVVCVVSAVMDEGVASATTPELPPTESVEATSLWDTLTLAWVIEQLEWLASTVWWGVRTYAMNQYADACNLGNFLFTLGCDTVSWLRATAIVEDAGGAQPSVLWEDPSWTLLSLTHCNNSETWCTFVMGGSECVGGVVPSATASIELAACMGCTSLWVTLYCSALAAFFWYGRRLVDTAYCRRQGGRLTTRFLWDAGAGFVALVVLYCGLCVWVSLSWSAIQDLRCDLTSDLACEVHHKWRRAGEGCLLGLGLILGWDVWPRWRRPLAWRLDRFWAPATLGCVWVLASFIGVGTGVLYGITAWDRHCLAEVARAGGGAQVGPAIDWEGVLEPDILYGSAGPTLYTLLLVVTLGVLLVKGSVGLATWVITSTARVLDYFTYGVGSFVSEQEQVLTATPTHILDAWARTSPTPDVWHPTCPHHVLAPYATDLNSLPDHGVFIARQWCQCGDVIEQTMVLRRWLLNAFYNDPHEFYKVCEMSAMTEAVSVDLGFAMWALAFWGWVWTSLAAWRFWLSWVWGVWDLEDVAETWGGVAMALWVPCWVSLIKGNMVADHTYVARLKDLVNREMVEGEGTAVTYSRLLASLQESTTVPTTFYPLDREVASTWARLAADAPLVFTRQWGADWCITDANLAGWLIVVGLCLGVLYVWHFIRTYPWHLPTLQRCLQTLGLVKQAIQQAWYLTRTRRLGGRFFDVKRPGQLSRLKDPFFAGLGHRWCRPKSCRRRGVVRKHLGGGAKVNPPWGPSGRGR